MVSWKINENVKPYTMGVSTHSLNAIWTYFTVSYCAVSQPSECIYTHNFLGVDLILIGLSSFRAAPSLL